MEWLINRMEQWGHTPALIWNGQSVSYHGILDRYRNWCRKLNEGFLRSASTVSVRGDYSPEVCGLLLALIDRKKIIIPLTDESQPQIDEFNEIAEVQVQISIDDADNSKIEAHSNKILNSLTKRLIEAREPGLILFSSGSTGKPKAALHNFSNLLKKFEIQRNRFIALNFLLFDHIGGINTLLYNFSNGGTIVATRNRNPVKICKLIEEFKIELLPTTPTFLNMLLMSEAHNNYNMSSLKLITYGTEVMPESLLQRISNCLPHVKLLQTYGLSELGILRSKSKSSDSLWMKIGGEDYETKIVDGILWIRAKSSMVGYLNAPNPFTPDGWFITGDSVEQNGEFVKILGRESDIINVGGQKVYPSEVESALQLMEGVVEVAVFGDSHVITGQIVNANVKLQTDESPVQFKKRMRQYCKDKLAPFKIPQKISIVNSDIHSLRFKKIRKANIPS